MEEQKENSKVLQAAIPEILDVQDLAELLRTDDDEVRKLIREEKIPAYMIGKGRYLISKKKFIEVIEEKTGNWGKQS